MRCATLDGKGNTQIEPPAIPKNEGDRLKAVQSLNVLDTPSEERFDKLTKGAAKDLRAPICTVSIVDADREWFKSTVGLEKKEGPRNASFCGHTILQGQVFVVEDTHKDPRFVDNPQSTNAPHIRFYAGVTLHDRVTHLPVGAFCIKDTKPRVLSSAELKLLFDYAAKAEVELNKEPKKTASSSLGEMSKFKDTVNKEEK